ncbi:unnamed protein product, partial [Rotaria sordida]
KGYGTVIGIDLGTTNYCVGVFKNNRVEIIANDQGNRITSSYIAFMANDERLIGDAAENQLIYNPEIIEKNSKPIIQINTSKEQTSFAPEETSAMLLRKMRETTEAYLREKITHAIITVPAYFNDAQRQATILAATISGLNIIRIINESTTAPIFISELYENKDEKIILVFHLGGGTFDVSLVKCEIDIFQVVATNGNTNLGGKDFDQRVVEYFIELFKNQTVEKAKRTLSSQYQANIEIESFFDNEDFSETFTRAKFEELNMDSFHLKMKLVVEALKNVNKSTIDEIVLVGGSTRIPKIHQLVKEFFYGKEPLCSVYLDESVVFGATIQAGFLCGAEKTRDIALLDVNPFSISIEVHDEKARKIIPRNIVIPFKECNIFTTAFDNQRTITFKVFEGESPIMKDNHILGKFDLHGIP